MFGFEISWFVGVLGLCFYVLIMSSEEGSREYHVQLKFMLFFNVLLDHVRLDYQIFLGNNRNLRTEKMSWEIEPKPFMPLY